MRSWLVLLFFMQVRYIGNNRKKTNTILAIFERKIFRQMNGPKRDREILKYTKEERIENYKI